MSIPPNRPGEKCDTVFDEDMKPVFINYTDVVTRRLKAKHPDNWTHVCMGEAGVIVTIQEYLYGDKFQRVVGIIEDLLEKKNLPMFQRHPERLGMHIKKAAETVFKIAEETVKTGGENREQQLDGGIRGEVRRRHGGVGSDPDGGAAPGRGDDRP